MNYLKISLHTRGEASGTWMAKLLDLGFESFEEEANVLHAYIPQLEFSLTGFEEALRENPTTFTTEIIYPKNWNSIWESNFEPIVVADKVSVRASFHPKKNDFKYDLIITPKMSFGTGHHATTWLMIKAMLDINFSGKTVFDFGTGTGILAILAEQLGAQSVHAIDIDSWSIENALENMSINNCSHIDLKQGEAPPQNGVFDIVLANINKHIILDNLDAIVAATAKGGFLLLSGLLADDEKDMKMALQNTGLTLQKIEARNNWICILLSKD